MSENTSENTSENPEENPEENGTAQPEKPQFVIPDDSSAFALCERAAWHLLEKKGIDLMVMDLRGRSDVCDFYVLCSASSATHVGALAKHAHNMMVAAGQKPKGLEGMTGGRWALLDFFDVVIHVFKADAREYFNLERLWGDAPQLEMDPEYFEDSAVIARHPDLNFSTAAGSDGNA